MHNMWVSIVLKEQRRINYKISVPEKSSTVKYKQNNHSVDLKENKYASSIVQIITWWIR